MPNWYWTKYSNECQSNAGWCRNFPKWQPTPHILYRLKNKELKLSNNSKNTWRLLLWAWISLICTAFWCRENSELHNRLIRRGTALQKPLPWLIPHPKVETKSRTQYICSQPCSFHPEACSPSLPDTNWEGSPISKKTPIFLGNLGETGCFYLAYNHAHSPMMSTQRSPLITVKGDFLLLIDRQWAFMTLESRIDYNPVGWHYAQHMKEHHGGRI